jgi:purine-binding chemotaxis protein CheW
MSSAPQPVNTGAVLVFSLAAADHTKPAMNFGLWLTDLVHVVESGKVTPVPLAPREIAGIMNYRGRILTVVDPAPLLGLDLQSAPPTNLVVLRPRQKTVGTLGLKITRAHKVFAADTLAPSTGRLRPCVTALVKSDQNLIQLISIESLLDELIDRVVKYGVVEIRQGVIQ